MILNVIIPSYNHEKYIQECLHSILKIKGIFIKIFVIDDCSTDNTLEKVNQLKSDYNGEHEINIIKKSENRGVVDSLNLGTKHLPENEYVYLIASDDLVDPDALSKAIETLDSSAFKFIISNGKNLLENGVETPVYNQEQYDFLTLQPRDRKESVFLNYPKPLLLQSVIFRTSLLHEIGFWDEDVVLDDYAIFIKIFNRELYFNVDYTYLENNMLIKYRKHAANSNANILRQYAMIRQLFNKYAPSHLLRKALAMRLSFYILIGVKRMDSRLVIDLIKLEDVKTAMLALIYLPLQIAKKIRR